MSTFILFLLNLLAIHNLKYWPCRTVLYLMTYKQYFLLQFYVYKFIIYVRVNYQVLKISEY
jgi:hypothetical protein